MTDRCAPPDGSPSGWYWLRYGDSADPAPWYWQVEDSGWTAGSTNDPPLSIEEMENEGLQCIRPCRPDDAEARERLEAEVARLLALINTPTVDEWFAGVRTEAAHQQERWGSHDAEKSPLDWFWLIGYLAQKVVSADTTEKALHHTVSTAAVLFNWHQAISGVDTRMHPGIEPPKDATNAR